MKSSPRVVRVVRAPVLAVLLLAVGLPHVPDARAGEFEEMRREFRKVMKDPEWKERRDAFMFIADYDRPETVTEILGVLRREDNAAVIVAGVQALVAQKSLGSRALLFKAARRTSGDVRLLVLDALGQQEGKAIGDFLLEIASGKDAQAAAQAAWALAQHPNEEGVPVLLKLLKSKDWQRRRAAAIALAAWDCVDAIEPLATALAASRGRDRNEMIAALERITGQSFGNDPAAWKAFAGGTSSDVIKAKPQLVPTVFGVPIYGNRVVICYDASLRMTRPHPFNSERMRGLCDPQDGEPIPWFRIKTIHGFAAAHVKHLVSGLPKGAKFELITFNAIVRNTFGKLTNVGNNAKRTAFLTLDELETDDGIDTMGALGGALDIGGAKEKQAWKSGPDEIVFITVNMPTKGDIREADVVAAAIALKAKLRMVPVHTVGIHNHPYDMCRAIAEKTGGIYVALTK